MSAFLLVQPSFTPFSSSSFFNAQPLADLLGTTEAPAAAPAANNASALVDIFGSDNFGAAPAAAPAPTGPGELSPGAQENFDK